jgi:hypothetical protein
MSYPLDTTESAQEMARLYAWGALPKDTDKPSIEVVKTVQYYREIKE